LPGGKKKGGSKLRKTKKQKNKNANRREIKPLSEKGTGVGTPKEKTRERGKGGLFERGKGASGFKSFQTRTRGRENLQKGTRPSSTKVWPDSPMGKNKIEKTEKRRQEK